MCVCLSVSVRERDRETETDWDRESVLVYSVWCIFTCMFRNVSFACMEFRIRHRTLSLHWVKKNMCVSVRLDFPLRKAMFFQFDISLILLIFKKEISWLKEEKCQQQYFVVIILCSIKLIKHVEMEMQWFHHLVGTLEKLLKENCPHNSFMSWLSTDSRAPFIKHCCISIFWRD